jgi:hypothetical protein
MKYSKIYNFEKCFMLQKTANYGINPFLLQGL